MTEGQGAPEGKRARGPLRAVLITLALLVGAVVLIGLPTYGDYTHRAQASEAVALLGAAKTPLAEYFEDRKRWPQSLDEVAGATSGKYTASLAITKSAPNSGEIEITATMRTDKVDRRVAGKSVRMWSSDGGRTWTCRPGTLPEKVLPQACRQPAP